MPERIVPLDFVQKVIKRMRDAGYGETLLGRLWDEAKDEAKIAAWQAEGDELTGDAFRGRVRSLERRRFIQGFIEGAEWRDARRMATFRDIRTPAAEFAEKRFDDLVHPSGLGVMPSEEKV